MNSHRHCNMERHFHGTCMNLELGMGCSQLPSSGFCLKYAEKNPELMSDESKAKIELAKSMGLYNETSAAVLFDVPCEQCQEGLVDVSSQKKVDGNYVCYECQFPVQ